MLTSQQQAHFDVFGFVAVRQLFPPDELDVIIREFDAAMLEERGGKPFDGKERQTVLNWYEGRPAVESIASDERITGLIEQLLGQDAAIMKNNDGNLYVGDTGWHADMGWTPEIPDGKADPDWVAQRRGKNHYIPSIKVAFYLDPVGRESGALRVVPGAHRNPYHDRLWSLHMNIPRSAGDLEDIRPRLLDMWERDTGGPEGGEQLLSDPDVNHFGAAPQDVPSYAIESEPGDAVFFSHQMWHSSFGGKAGRRMFTLNFRSAQTIESLIG